MRTLRSKLDVWSKTRYSILDIWYLFQNIILPPIGLDHETTICLVASWLRGFVASWLRGFVASWRCGFVAYFVAFCCFLLLFVAFCCSLFWCFLLLFLWFYCVFMTRFKKHWKTTCFSNFETKVSKKHRFYCCFFTCKTWTQKSDSRIGFIGVLRKC